MHENEFCNLKDDHDLDLLEVGLMLYPEDLELLHIKFKHEVRFLRLSIHEVPWIVMAGERLLILRRQNPFLKDLSP